jgi:hypothetical protein
MTSTSDDIRVYVQLLHEGTVVFRPTQAVPVGPGLLRLLETPGYDPEDEDWEFKPGATVRVERRMLSGGDALVAVAQVHQDRER